MKPHVILRSYVKDGIPRTVIELAPAKPEPKESPVKAFLAIWGGAGIAIILVLLFKYWRMI